MNIKASKRTEKIEEGIFCSLAKMGKAAENQGMQVIDLSQGNPDIAPSLDIREAVSQSSLLAWNYSYASEDMLPLREAACSWYLARFGVPADPETEIVSLNGSQDALVHMFLAFTDPGDKVLVCDPYCPAVMTGIQLAGAEPVFMPLRPENDYLPDLKSIPEETADEARLMVVSYPNDPTGALATDAFWEELISFAGRHEIMVVNDNAYSDITYDGVTAKSFLAYEGAKEVGIELNSLSQTYAIPGMRCAFAVGNERMVSVLSKLKSNIDAGKFYPVQYGMIAALTQEQSCVEDIRSIYEERRNCMTQALAEIGLPPVPCRGTIHLWVPLPEGAADDRLLCRELFMRTGVLLAPGSAFGNEGKGHVRISLVRKSQVLKEAARAIAESGLIV